MEEAAGIITTQEEAAVPTMALAVRGDGPLAAVGGGARALMWRTPAGAMEGWL